MYKDYSKKKQVEYYIVFSLLAAAIVAIGEGVVFDMTQKKTILIVVMTLVVGYLLGRISFSLVQIRKHRTEGEKINELLYQAVRHSDVAEVIDLLLAGAKASDLREQTVRHSVKNIRRILKFFRMLNH